MGPVKCEPFSNLPSEGIGGGNKRKQEYSRVLLGFNELFTLQIGSLICIRKTSFSRKEKELMVMKGSVPLCGRLGLRLQIS